MSTHLPTVFVESSADTATWLEEFNFATADRSVNSGIVPTSVNKAEPRFACRTRTAWPMQTSTNWIFDLQSFAGLVRVGLGVIPCALPPTEVSYSGLRISAVVPHPRDVGRTRRLGGVRKYRTRYSRRAPSFRRHHWRRHSEPCATYINAGEMSSRIYTAECKHKRLRRGPINHAHSIGVVQQNAHYQLLHAT